MKKKIIRYLIISHLTFILSIGGMAVAFYYYHTAQMAQIKNANILLISKDEMKLRLIDYKGQELFTPDIKELGFMAPTTHYLLGPERPKDAFESKIQN